MVLLLGTCIVLLAEPVIVSVAGLCIREAAKALSQLKQVSGCALIDLMDTLILLSGGLVDCTR